MSRRNSSPVRTGLPTEQQTDQRGPEAADGAPRRGAHGRSPDSGGAAGCVRPNNVQHLTGLDRIVQVDEGTG
jgi:hypothetical protein